MVIPTSVAQASSLANFSLALLLAGADGKPGPVWQRLDPALRAKLLAALAAFVILGISLMFLAWMGARATRRYMAREPLSRERAQSLTPVREKDWADKPISEPPADE